MFLGNMWMLYGQDKLKIISYKPLSVTSCIGCAFDFVTGSQKF